MPMPSGQFSLSLSLSVHVSIEAPGRPTSRGCVLGSNRTFVDRDDLSSELWIRRRHCLISHEDRIQLSRGERKE